MLFAEKIEHVVQISVSNGRKFQGWMDSSDRENSAFAFEMLWNHTLIASYPEIEYLLIRKTVWNSNQFQSATKSPMQECKGSRPGLRCSRSNSATRSAESTPATSGFRSLTSPASSLRCSRISRAHSSHAWRGWIIYDDRKHNNEDQLKSIDFCQIKFSRTC